LGTFLFLSKLVILPYCLQYWTVKYIVGATDLESGSGSVEKAKVGTAGFLIELENRRAIKVGGFDSLRI
jgi:hypothetical protein